MWTFVTIEAALVISWLVLDTMRINSATPLLQAGTAMRLVYGVYSLSVLLLMIGSPFFLRALRWIALLGWLLGIVAFLTSGLYFF